MKNIFKDLPEKPAEEVFDTLLRCRNVQIERITSYGHATPAGQWYDQAQDEWVLLLQGEALLSFENGKKLRLNPGDYVFIPARQKHRVEWTAPNTNTVWLAVHIFP